MSATVFIQIKLLSFHTNDTYIHANVPGIAKYKLMGNILEAVSIILVMMNREPIHLISVVMSFSPIVILR